jgi:ferric-dicitrate binding protein FerR (iron transport regulator)
VTTSHDAARERARTLMMAALDGECSMDERRELESLLAGAPDLAADFRRMARVKEVTTGMRLQSPPEEVWDRYWTSVYSRAERGVAWVLISAGAVILSAYWLWQAIAALLADTTVPALIRVAVLALGLGLVILLVSVLREKMFTHRRDPYEKEIVR